MVMANLLTYLGNGAAFPEAFERAAFMPYADFLRSWR
jgi:hypothetical protein